MPEDYKQYLIVGRQEATLHRGHRERRRGPRLRVRDIATVSWARRITCASSPATASRRRCSTSRGRWAATRRHRRQRRRDRASLRATLPPGVRLKPVYDQAALVRDAVKSVRDAMLIGAVLAVIVLLVFLRHARITAISASSIPLTMAITVFVMSLVGQTFNLMTLGAMAIAIGS
jgi:Cu/Ag efflux pump CusA